MNKHYYGLYFSLLACLLLSLLYSPPFDLGMSDKEIFTYTGRAIAKGLVPYRDFFDHKPPLIFFINYAGTLLGGAWGLWVLNTALAMVTTGVFFGCCRRHRLTWPWLLPLLLNLMIRDNLISEGINMTREYGSWFTILFFCVLMGTSRYRYFFMGLLTGLVFFIQQDQVLPLLPFLVYALFTTDRTKEKGGTDRPKEKGGTDRTNETGGTDRPVGTAILSAGRRALAAGAGFATILLPAVLYFAFHRSLGVFWEDAFRFNLAVYTTERKSLGDHFRTIKRVLDAGNYELPFMVALSLGIVALVRPNKKKGLIVAAFAAFLLSLSAEFMGGRFKGQAVAVDYYYYFIPLSAGVCILLFTLFAFPEKTAPADWTILLPYALLLCSSLAYTAFQHGTHLLRRDEDPVINSAELRYLRQHPPGDYQLYVFENDDFIAAYNEFRILSPSRWIYQHFWNWYPDWDSDGRILYSITEDLQRHHTTYVIMDPANTAAFRNLANYHRWMDFLQSHYQPVPMPGNKQSLLWQLKANP